MCTDKATDVAAGSNCKELDRQLDDKDSNKKGTYNIAIYIQV